MSIVDCDEVTSRLSPLKERDYDEKNQQRREGIEREQRADGMSHDHSLFYTVINITWLKDSLPIKRWSRIRVNTEWTDSFSSSTQWNQDDWEFRTDRGSINIVRTISFEKNDPFLSFSFVIWETNHPSSSLLWRCDRYSLNAWNVVITLDCARSAVIAPNNVNKCRYDAILTFLMKKSQHG